MIKKKILEIKQKKKICILIYIKNNWNELFLNMIGSRNHGGNILSPQLI